MEEWSDGAFECSGKVNLNDFHLNRNSLLLRGELERVVHSLNDYTDADEGNIRVFGEFVGIQSIFSELEHYTKRMQMGMKVLNRFRRYDNGFQSQRNSNQKDYFELRKQINEFLIHIRRSLNNLNPEMSGISFYSKLFEDLDTLTAVIRRFLSELKEILDSTLHYSVSNIGNKSNQPEFHLYHLHLEIRWLIISFHYTRASRWRLYERVQMESLIEDLNRTIYLVISDLVYISLKIFERSNVADLRQKSPFNCTCIRELWLMIQLFIEDFQEQMKLNNFWDYLNQILDNHVMKSKKDPDVLKDWFDDEEFVLPDCKHPELFSVWVTYHLALLQGYNKQGNFLGPLSGRVTPNFDQIEKILKSFSNKCSKDEVRDDVDDELKVMIPLIRVLSEDWWSPKAMVINYLWECFHRRLKLHFLIQTSERWAISVDKKTPVDILKQIKDRIDCNLDQGKESSYGMFLSLLASILKRSQDRNDLKCWQQIKGRIFSKFSTSKVSTFDESALYNFISLFLTLAIVIDPQSVCPTMLNLLPDVQSVAGDTLRRATLIWKGLLGTLIIYIEKDLNLEVIATKLVNSVKIICCQKDDVSKTLMNIFVETLCTQFKSMETFANGEHLFFDGWIERYLCDGPASKTTLLFQMFSDIFEKCSHNRVVIQQSDKKILDALWYHVAGKVRTFVFAIEQTERYHEELAKLASDFTFDALKNPSVADAHRHSAPKLFQHFTSIYTVQDARIIKFYLSRILSKPDAVASLKARCLNELSIDFDTLVVQSWAKCCIHNLDADAGEMRIIKSYLLELYDFQLLFSTRMEVQEFRESKESILLFVMTYSKKRNLFQKHQISKVEDKIHSILKRLEKWLLIPINDGNKDSELALWIYRFLGTILLCCSKLLLSRSLLVPFISMIALPIEPEKSFVKHLAKKIFPMIILGLDDTGVEDITILKLISELFHEYLPLLVTQEPGSSSFTVADSMTRCFVEAKPRFVGCIFDKVSLFLKIHDKSTSQHCHLVMALLNHLLTYNLSPKFVTEFIISKCLRNILECYTKVHEFHPHRQQTVSFISAVFTNVYYENDSTLRENFRRIVLSVLNNFGLSYSNGTYKLLKSMFQMDTEMTKSIILRLEENVVELEKYRRPNAGSHRDLFTQLQSLLETAPQ